MVPLPEGFNFASSIESCKSAMNVSAIVTVNLYRKTEDIHQWLCCHHRIRMNEYRASNVHTRGSIQRVQVPPPRGHLVTNLHDIHLRVLGTEGNNRGGWISQNIKFRYRRIDGVCDETRAIHNRTARLEITTERRLREIWTRRNIS